MTFEEMTDEQFYVYLKDKYGDKWHLISLTQEEWDRLPRIFPKQIAKLLKQGHKERLQAEKHMLPPYIPSHIFFRQ